MSITQEQASAIIEAASQYAKATADVEWVKAQPEGDQHPLAVRAIENAQRAKWTEFTRLVLAVTDGIPKPPEAPTV